MHFCILRTTCGIRALVVLRNWRVWDWISKKPQVDLRSVAENISLSHVDCGTIDAVVKVSLLVQISSGSLGRLKEIGFYLHENIIKGGSIIALLKGFRSWGRGCPLTFIFDQERKTTCWGREKEIEREREGPHPFPFAKGWERKLSFRKALFKIKKRKWASAD